MSRAHPATRRYPHRLTLPVTVAAFLAPWVASGWIPPERPVLVDVAQVGRSPDDTPEVLALVERQQPTAAEPGSSALAAQLAAGSPAVIVAPAEPLAQGAPPASELEDHERKGQAALGRVTWPWQDRLPGWRIVFQQGGAGHGLTNPATKRMDVSVPGGSDVFSVARVAAHEIGHAADLTFNDTAARRAWKSQRGIPADAPWWPSGSGSDFSTGAGDFAECFASWQLGIESLSAWGPCSAGDLEMLASMVSG
ncbi:MAG: hypothetical protein AAF480_12665 [Actinomycetota bacterium]